MSPVVGVTACTRSLDDADQFAAYAIYCRALMEAAGAVPVLVPPVGERALAILDRLDGLLLTGSVSNVEPHRYGCPTDATPGQHDPARDETMLPMIREAVRRGMPVFAICRGIQELNVALGGTLHQEVHVLPGRMDHREPDGPLDVQFALRQDIAVSGGLARLLGATRVRVNSLHGQAVDRPAPGLAVEAVARDGTVEAVRGTACAGFVLGVQWHPEWHVAHDPPSRTLFAAFGAACSTYASGLRRAA
jgi:putative glutamine amidotransferase